ncbi:MAG: PorP/SprF family type IX secretion system membrane protein [Bacteroidota bacterium]|nr:PorP/SprF family type IX secretion system membrane protein [Bacteroidota bacterium]
MKRFLTTILFFFITSISLFGQQDPQISHYFFMKEFYNPAYAGFDGNINANLISHQQWKKITGAPFTTILSLDAPITPFGINGGVGINIIDDRYGFVRDFRGNIALSYNFNLGLGKLSFGINPGIFSKKFEPQWKFPDQNETILNENINATIFDIGAGVYYSLNNIFVGFSSFHLLRPNINFVGTDGTSSSSIFLTNHYYLMAGYNMKIANSTIDLTPSIFLKSDGNIIQSEINIYALYNKKIWLSVSYRNKDALVFFAGTSYFNNIKLGISYDVTLSYLNRVTN